MIPYCGDCIQSSRLKNVSLLFKVTVIFSLARGQCKTHTLTVTVSAVRVEHLKLVSVGVL